MKFTYSWLCDHLDTKLDANSIGDILTNIGLELENLTDYSKTHGDFVVASIIEFKKHPNADRLNLCTVDDGSKKYQVVCGANNVKKNLKGIFAKEGLYIPGIDLTLKKGKIRGEISEGMMLSERELGLSDEHEGIIEISENIVDGTDAVTALSLNDPIFEVAITPNRGDCLSVRGIARDLAAKGCGTLKNLKIEKIKSSDFESPIKWMIKDDGNSCEYVLGRYFRGVSNLKSPEWLVKKLISIGLRPINILADITNFITIDLGRPLHVFDADKIDGDLTMRLSNDGDKVDTLDNKNYKLSNINTIISDSKKIHGIAGIIGGLESGCSENTKNVFLEVASFKSSGIAKSARSLGIFSDARQRFERGIDKAFVEKGMDYASSLIINCCGGEASFTVDAGSLNSAPVFIDYEFEKFTKIIGFSLDGLTQIKYLENLGFKILKINTTNCTIEVPTWRNDIESSIDLIEEIIRLHGFDHIREEKVISTNEEKLKIKNSPSNKRYKIYERLKKILASEKYQEIITFSFHSNLSHSTLKGSKSLRLSNAISEEFSYMRNSMFGNHLNALEENRKKGFDQQGVFEIGPIYENINLQHNILSMMTFPMKGNNTVFKSEIFGFNELSSQISILLKELNFDMKQFVIKRSENEMFHPGKSAELWQGKKLIAHYGAIHPLIVQNFTKVSEVYAAEVYIDNLPLDSIYNNKKISYFESSYPYSEKDFSFIFDKNQNLFEVYKSVLGIDKKLIHEVDFFDQFYSEDIGINKKSITFRIKIQSKDKTLDDKELEDIFSKVIDTIINKFDAQLRS
jgi:phenylalanyl-tRNA synthetase beta chain